MATRKKTPPPQIRIGIGGWTYEPWRGSFYPEGLAQKRELEYASRKLTSIEVNGTFYGSQKPATFMKWHDETPDDFVFSLKAPRYATNRRVLSEAGETIERFFASGVLELKDKLGPINWQFAPTKQFDADDFEGFLQLLPERVDGRAIRHAVEVRHESFRDEASLPSRASTGSRSWSRAIPNIRRSRTRPRRSSTLASWARKKDSAWVMPASSSMPGPNARACGHRVAYRTDSKR